MMITRAVLFDLDGTFADTAPDLQYAVNRMRSARRLPPLPIHITRPVTSMGARGLIGVSFDIAPGHPDYLALREEFLEIYGANLCHESRLFDGIDDLLRGLEARSVQWGIVTNKAERFARPLIERFNLDGRCSCIVGGDTTPHIKPHPEPLLAACQKLSLNPAECIYVGDDERDVAAARAAGMKSIAVAYGYLNGGQPDAWGADAVIERPQDVLIHLELGA